MAVQPKDLGLVSAYGAALEGGYTGTYDEYKTKMLELLNLNLSSLGNNYDDTEIRNLLAEKADKTEIPSAYDDTEIRNLVNGKMDTVTLASVATSGSYNDLSDKPNIPSVPSSIVNGVKGSNESSYRSGNVNITPGNLGLASVATSGNYNDLNNKPTIPGDTKVKIEKTGVATTTQSSSVLIVPFARYSNVTDSGYDQTETRDMTSTLWYDRCLSFRPNSIYSPLTRKYYGALEAAVYKGIFNLDYAFVGVDITPTINPRLKLAANGGEVYGASYIIPTSVLAEKYKPVALCGYYMSGSGYTNCSLVECRLSERAIHYGAKNHGSSQVNLTITVCIFCLPYTYFGDYGKENILSV